MSEPVSIPPIAADSVQVCLKGIIEKYGSDVHRDPRRLRAILRDLCPHEVRKTNLIVLAAERGIPAELLRRPHDALGRQRLALRLSEEFAILEKAASWTIAAWAGALCSPEPPQAAKAEAAKPPILTQDDRFALWTAALDRHLSALAGSTRSTDFDSGALAHGAHRNMLPDEFLRWVNNRKVKNDVVSTSHAAVSGLPESIELRAWLAGLDVHLRAMKLTTRAKDFRLEALWYGFTHKMTAAEFLKTGYNKSEPLPKV